MGKVRVYVLARELGVSSAEMLEKLHADGHEAATASSSVSEDVAARYRGKPPAGGAPSSARKAKGSKGGKQPAAPALPPPKPIEKRAKAVKPKPKRPSSDDELKAAEERRQARLARMRRALSSEESPAEEAPAAAEAAPQAEEAEQVAEAAPAAAQEAAPQEQAAEVAAEQPPPAAAEEDGGAPPAEETSAPGAGGGLQLPHVVRPASAPEPEPQAPPREEPEKAPAPSSPPQGAPQPAAARTTREFRGPIRKIELPPQPQRPGPGRPPSAGITRTFSTRPGTGLGKHRKKKRRGAAAQPAPAPQVAPVAKGEGRVLRLTEGVSVKELAEKMDVKAKDLIKILMMRGSMVTVNMALEPELATSLAEEFGYKPEVVSFEEDLQAQEEEEVLEKLEESGEIGDEVPRPPIVTVMGHVDHGKTSLLDAIRKTNVVAGEAGGITQSIGAYQVEAQGKKITFIDTPGHEAFTTMRSRGAQVTDIVVLVVAATDSVMPQTIEAINHAKAADVPVIVAVNKVDLPNARPDRTRSDLMSHGIVVENFGGDVVAVDVSAVKGTGISDLLDMVLLSTEMLGLKAMPARRATGIVVEAGVDRGMGAVANVLVQDGTLRTGDAIILGSEYGRVRALIDDKGERIEEAEPSMPVQVMGLNGVPNAGDRFQVVEDESRAKEISEFRKHKRREAELAKSGPRGTLQDLSRAIAEGETKELGVVLKADVHGAVEVLTKTVEELSTEKVKTKIIHAGTGAITDSDVLLATASDAIIVGFNVRPERSAADLAEREKVVVRLHTVIYHLTEELKGLMAGLLDVIREEEFLGRAEVRQTFKVPRVGVVAGSYVQEGKIVRNAQARLVRDGVVIWEGKLSSLKRFKEDAREVMAGLECGIGLENYNDVKVGDAIEAFNIKEVRPTLE